MYDHILVPTDGSEGALGAADEAIGLASEYDATLHVLYAVNESAIPPDAGAGQVIESLESAGAEAIEEIADLAREGGVEDVETTVAMGAPHRAILDYASEHGIDLIVMGTHGRTGLDRYLLGSVTEKVVRKADAPVLTVRVGTED